MHIRENPGKRDPYQTGLFPLVAIHVASRAVYSLLGVRFDYLPVETHWQFLDVHVLESAPLQGLAGLHSQPPLMNALFAAATRLTPWDHGELVVKLLFLLLGFVTVFGVYTLVWRLNARAFALPVAALYACSPTVILFENYFFYPHMVAAFLVAACMALERYLTTRRVAWLAAFWAAIAATALTRSLFHLVWVLAIAAALLWAVGVSRRTIVAASLALLLAGGWYAKNLAVAGRFTASTWMWISVAKLVQSGLDPERLRQLRDDGTVSEVFLIPAFSPITAYDGLIAPPPPAGNPALDARLKVNGASNYNYSGYLAVSDACRDDSLAVLKRDPALVARRQVDTWTLYAQPASQYFHFIRQVFVRGGFHATNVAAVSGVERAYDAVILLQAWDEGPDETLMLYHRPEALFARLGTISWTVVLGSLAIAFGLPAVIRRRWKQGGAARTEAIVLAFMAFNVCYVAVVGNLLEIGENQRFRFETEALFHVLVAVLLSVAVARARGRGGVSPDPAASSSEADPAG